MNDHGRARPRLACGESATYSLFSRARHAGRHLRWHTDARPPVGEIFVVRGIAEILRSNVYSQDGRSIRTGRFGESRRWQAPPQLRAGGVAIAQQPLPDEGDHFIRSRCLPQAALPIGGILMRVKDKNAPRGGVHPNTVAAVVAGILGAGGLAVTGSAHAQTAPATTTLAAAPTSEQATQSLQTVVVTATATQVKKLDASYNIVSASLQQIFFFNDTATTEIYKLSPGVWP